MAKKKPGSGDNYPSLFDQVKDQREELLKEVRRVERELTKLYGATYKDVLQLSAVRKAIENGANFEWDANAAANKKLDAALTNLANATTALLQSSVVASWAKGEANTEKNLYAALGGGKAGKEAIQKTADLARASLRERSATAEDYFNGKLNGFNVSDRVWDLKGEAKRELEIIIQNGIKEGKTPETIAKQAQQYLKEPNKLFRRVRDKDTGELELSAAAKKYHPGQGVYRSSYKNALRLARTEITSAYRRAEWESYQSNPLITGYEIRLSNNHTTTTSSGKTVKLVDICDKMAGRYPKTFEWTGWHPQCRCVMVPITVSNDDFKERIKALKKGQLQEWKPKDTVTEMPAAYTKWMKENEARLLQARTLPYWIRDNYKDGDIKKGFVRQIAELKKEVKKAQEAQQACSLYDEDIRELEKWATSCGLDLSNVYSLRAAGDPAALHKEIERLKDEFLDIHSEWSSVLSRLRQLQQRCAGAGFTDLADRIEADINKRKVSPALNAKATISELNDLMTEYIREHIKATKEAAAKTDPIKDNEKAISLKLGIQKGETMDFKQANENRGNKDYIPRFISEGTSVKANPDYKPANYAYHINCQSCVVANELRRRGYDVTAQPNLGKGSAPEELSRDTAKIWIDPATGKAPQKQTAGGWYMEGYRIKSYSRSKMFNDLLELTKEPGRYHIDWAWSRGNSGHIITCERLADGKLRIYDPQNGEIVAKASEYFKGISLRHGIKVLRVDGLLVNTDMIGGIVRASGK